MKAFGRNLSNEIEGIMTFIFLILILFLVVLNKHPSIKKDTLGLIKKLYG